MPVGSSGMRMRGGAAPKLTEGPKSIRSGALEEARAALVGERDASLESNDMTDGAERQHAGQRGSARSRR